MPDELGRETSAPGSALDPDAGATPPPGNEPADESVGRDGPRLKVTDRRFWALGAETLAGDEARRRLPTYVEQLKTDLEDRERQLRETIAAYKKEVVEELEKTKLRLERDAAARAEQLRGQLATPLLEVLDALERSLAAAVTNVDSAALREGVRLVHLLMVQKLGELGLTRIAAVGQRFDPARHEAAAAAAVADPAQDNVVLIELKPGFTLGERVVRPALVQVGRYQR